MRNIFLIGDVHSLFGSYFNLVNYLDCDETIQLGDLGIGYDERYENTFPVTKNHLFIRGNHDNPELCKNHSHFLGEYGITKDGIFFVSGASTPPFDQTNIKFYNEELTHEDFQKVLELYENTKPEIIISHSSIIELIPDIFGECAPIYDSRTQRYFSEMLNIHKPKKWICGHLHANFHIIKYNVEFIVLDELSYYKLEI